MLFSISRNSGSRPEWATNMQQITVDAWSVYFRGNDEGPTQSRSNETSFQFVSTKPIIRKENGEFEMLQGEKSLLELQGRAENNFSGLEFRSLEGGWTIIGNSARMGRARLYFTRQNGTLFFSEDLRDLLPFTSRKLKPIAAFSVLKYGEVSEYITVVEDIWAIPVACKLTITPQTFDAFVNKYTFDRSDIEPYFRFPLPMDGGDIPKTEKLLEDQYRFIVGLKPLVPISGGVDSTLINCLLNRFSDERYPAYYMQFGDEDTEAEFAIRAAKDTKADLYIGKFTPSDMIESFNFQCEQLFQPIGESSSMSLSYYFSQHLQPGRTIVDGTLADGCYGSVNYNRDLLGENPTRPQWQQELNEKIGAFIQFHGLPGKDRFFPRDSLMKDPYLQFMDVYLGPFANTWVKDARNYCTELLPLWQDYYHYFDVPTNEQDDWTKYSVFKMVAYASRITMAKTTEVPLPDNQGLYPFAWLSIMEDSGHYSWAEKTAKNTIKYPLKKILEKYMPHDFIHRKKVGLNACFEDWIHIGENRGFLINKLKTTGGIAEYFFGRSRRDALVKKFASSTLHPNLARMVINITLMQGWMDHNNVTVNGNK